MTITLRCLKRNSWIFSFISIQYQFNLHDQFFLIFFRHMYPIKPKGLSLDLGFQFFQYLGFGFWVGVFCKSLANFELDNLKYEKLIFNFWVWIWVSILIFFLVFLIYTQIHTQKLKISFSYLNYLIRNLQEIWKYPNPNPKPKYWKNWKPKPRLKPLGFIGCICVIFFKTKLLMINLKMEHCGSFNAPSYHMARFFYY